MRKVILLFVVILAAGASAAAPQPRTPAAVASRFKLDLSKGSRQDSIFSDLALPSRDPAVVVPHLQAFTSANTYADVLRILGQPDLDVGSAGIIATFELTDGVHIEVLARLAGPVSEIILHPFHQAAGGGGMVLFADVPRGLTMRSSEQAPAVELVRTFTLDLAGACR